MPLALPIAVLSFLGGFIPYIGQAATSLLAFFVAVKYGTTQDIVIMGMYTIVMNVVQGNFIAPLVYGRAVSIHPAIVLLAIPAGGELAGVLGMFLAVPVIGVFAAVGGTCSPRSARAARCRTDRPADHARCADGDPAARADSGTRRSLRRTPGIERADRRRPARRSSSLGVRAGRQAGCGFGSGTGCPGPMIVGIPWMSSFGGMSLNSASNPSESTVSSATSFSASAIELVAVGDQDLRRPLVRLVDDRPDLLVDRLGDLVAVVALLADLAAEEHELVALPERERAELVAHPELGDHPAGQVGRLLDVVAGAGRRVAEDQPLGGVAAEEPGDLVLELGLALEVAVLLSAGPSCSRGPCRG